MEVFYDWISLLLWSVELTILSIALVFVFFAIRGISQDAVLHYNYRVLMIIVILRAPIQTISRCVVIYNRAFVYGPVEFPTELQSGINAGKRFQQSEVGFALFFLAFERIFACSDDKYEGRFRRTQSKAFITAFFLFPGLLMLGLFFVNGASLSSAVETTLTLFAYFLAAITILILWRISLSKFARRHSLGLQLSAKFATTQNIRASRISFPCILNECICYGLIVILGVISVTILKQEAGSDPTKLSHAFDMIAAYQSLFIPLFLTYKRRSIKRESMANIQSVDREKATDVYFQAYQSRW
ncbi:hypothetical protein PRIPAC_90302 [Pristionchus pacificus]|uniref:Uncharacterized protein n=1 Tax=Pristionchus pacificus TaxID=54126 RepID=A0A2A6CJ08_PRIPA|nr:hypothetical protein PRIPAC_90302 [Pristionchus pacificus]|eukprot:PDM78096.1 hypothetical protein PRIPAC_30481 [Pristionchus pacificus]